MTTKPSHPLLLPVSVVLFLSCHAASFLSPLVCLKYNRNGRYHQAWGTTTTFQGQATVIDNENDNDDTYHDVTDPLLPQTIRDMTEFFAFMVDESIHRFYYLCLPQSVTSPSSSSSSSSSFFNGDMSKAERIHRHVPMRDLAAAWDATKALRFWWNHPRNHNDDDHDDDDDDQKVVGGAWLSHHQAQDEILEVLVRAVDTTLDVYYYPTTTTTSTTRIRGEERRGLCMDVTTLKVNDGDAPTIGHSAMWILAATGELRRMKDGNERRGNDGDATSTTTTAKRAAAIEALTKGILSQQRSDGAFQIHFDENGIEDTGGTNDNDKNVLRGIEFYPGEAMVALMEVYELSFSSSSTRSEKSGYLMDDEATQRTILKAMKHGFIFYSTYYYNRQGDLDTNYHIWQIQAFARLFVALKVHGGNKDDHNDSLSAQVAVYVLQMCQDIVRSRAWKELYKGKSFYPNLETLEIACGLDALVDGLQVALMVEGETDQSNHLSLHIDNAVGFLKWAQDQAGNGGLGYGGIQILEQRLDVTGHALSALTKLQ